MRRWLPAVALGAALAAVAMAGVLALRSGSAADATRADALAAELRCPDCAGLSVADSPTRSAREIRRQIDELVASGASDAEVRGHFAARYGEWILLAPSSPAAWLIPAAVVLAGVAALATWLVRRPRVASTPPPVSPEERRRLREEVDALDG